MRKMRNYLLSLLCVAFVITSSGIDESLNTDQKNPSQARYMTPNVDGDQLFFENGNSDLFWAQFGSPSPLISLSLIHI